VKQTAKNSGYISGIQCAAVAVVRFTDKPPQWILWGVHDTVCGPMLVGLDEAGALRFFTFAKDSSVLKAWQRRWPRAVFTEDADATRRIVEIVFTPAAAAQRGVTLRLSGTPFQQAVWRAMLAIPYGRTAGYAAIAQRIGRPKAVRAVGTACGANPAPVLIPCHRVIASDGSLGGFGGGLALKRAMLAAEQGGN